MPLGVLRSFVASTPNGVTPESATADELGWISIESPRERHYAATSRETSSVTCDGAGATGGTLRPIKGREDTRSNRRAVSPCAVLYLNDPVVSKYSIDTAHAAWRYDTGKKSRVWGTATLEPCFAARCLTTIGGRRAQGGHYDQKTRFTVGSTRSGRSGRRQPVRECDRQGRRTWRRQRR